MYLMFCKMLCVLSPDLSSIYVFNSKGNKKNKKNIINTMGVSDKQLVTVPCDATNAGLPYKTRHTVASSLAWTTVR